MWENLFPDLLELLFVVAIGGTLFAAIQRLRRGQIEVYTCPSCNRAISRAYPRCPKCGAGVTGDAKP